MDRVQAMALYVKIVETGSFSEAARQIGLSRAVASKVVQGLEARLGVRLLNRTTRRLSVTEAGTAYYRRAARIIADIAEAEEEAGRDRLSPRGTLRVTAPVALGGRYVVPLLTRYLDRYPDMAVDVALNDRFVDIVEDGFDLAIRVGRLADSSLVSRRLAECDVVLCAAPSYLARAGRPREPRDLSRHSCLSYTYDAMRDDWSFDGPGGTQRVSIRGRFRANSGDAIQRALLDGVGIALQPRFFVADALRSGRLEALMTGWSVPPIAVHALYPAGRHLSAKVRLFVDVLARHFAPHPPWEAGPNPANGKEPS